MGVAACQLCRIAHRHVDDQETSRQILQVIFTKHVRIGLLGFRVLCPINCLTHLNLLFLLLSYNACAPWTPLGPAESTVLHWELVRCPSGEGKSTQGYASYSTAHCWVCCQPLMIHSDGKGKSRKGKRRYLPPTDICC